MVDLILNFTSMIKDHDPTVQRILVFIGIMIGAIVYKIWNFNDLSTSSLPKFSKLDFLRFLSAVIMTFVVYDVITRIGYIRYINLKVGNLGFSIGLGVISETLTSYIMSDKLQKSLIEKLIDILTHLSSKDKDSTDSGDSKGGKDE